MRYLILEFVRIVGIMYLAVLAEVAVCACYYFVFILLGKVSQWIYMKYRALFKEKRKIDS